MTNGHADATGWTREMRLFNSASCDTRRTPAERRREDALVLGSSLFTVFLCLFVVLLG